MGWGRQRWDGNGDARTGMVVLGLEWWQWDENGDAGIGMVKPG